LADALDHQGPMGPTLRFTVATSALVRRLTLNPEHEAYT
jgi:hypothetical protein